MVLLSVAIHVNIHRTQVVAKRLSVTCPKPVNSTPFHRQSLSYLLSSVLDVWQFWKHEGSKFTCKQNATSKSGISSICAKYWGNDFIQTGRVQ